MYRYCSSSPIFAANDSCVIFLAPNPHHTGSTVDNLFTSMTVGLTLASDVMVHPPLAA